MSLATFSLADASIAQVEIKDGGKRPPTKRTTTALADRKLAPEPR